MNSLTSNNISTTSPYVSYDEIMKEVRYYKHRLDLLKKHVSNAQLQIDTRVNILDKFSSSLYSKVNNAEDRVKLILQTAFDNRNEDAKMCSGLYDICKTFVDAIDHYTATKPSTHSVEPLSRSNTKENRGRKKIPLLYKGVCYSCMDELCRSVGIAKNTGIRWKSQGKITVYKKSM